MTYLDDLARELGARGIGGRLRRRILLEVEDHLRSDPSAVARFGRADEIADAFAAELGAHASRRAALVAFAALAVAGAAYATCVASLSFAVSTPEPMSSVVVALSFATMIVAPQVAFVAGSLALVRAVRRRRERVLPARELAVIRRRAAVAVGAGLAALAAVAVYAHAAPASPARWWVDLADIATIGASAVLLVALVPVVSAARLRPRLEGEADDVFDDLRLAGLRARPWRFARLVAAAAAALVWFAAAVQGDPIDGALQGAAEALACLAGFAALGRYLGLRR
jgi:hypothetical protein